MSVKRRRLFPRTLSECMEPVTKPVLQKHGLTHARILRDWVQIVGTEIAMQTQPQKITYPQGSQGNGTLTVGVTSGFATVLQHMEPQLLEKLSAYFGYRAIIRIKLQHIAISIPPASPPPVAPITLPPSGDALQDALARLEAALRLPKS